MAWDGQVTRLLYTLGQQTFAMVGFVPGSLLDHRKDIQPHKGCGHH